MIIQFRVADTAHTSSIEVLLDRQLVATIHPYGEDGIKLLSAHVKEVGQDHGDYIVIFNTPPD